MTNKEIIKNIARLPSGTVVNLPEKDFDESFNNNSDGAVMIERIRIESEGRSVKVNRDP
jgi:hypothetical protein